MVPSLLSLWTLRTFISIAILVGGAVVFGCSSNFAMFSMCSLSGNTVVALGLFLIGASLWVGG